MTKRDHRLMEKVDTPHFVGMLKSLHLIMGGDWLLIR